MKNLLTLTLIGLMLAVSTGVSAQDDDDKKRRRHRHSTQQEFKIDIGLNNYLQDGEFPDASGEIYAVNPWKSWYFAMGTLYNTKIAGPVSLEWGGDISWYNWNFEDPNTILVRDGAVAEFRTSTDAEIIPEKSKLKVSYLNASVVPMIRLGKSSRSFRVGAGVYGGYKLGSTTKFTYNRDGQSIKDKNSENYYIENLRYGVRGRVGFRDFDFFINYDMNDLFVDARGPKLNGISMGVSLIDFH